MRLWCQGSEMHRLVLFCFLLELFICTGCKFAVLSNPNILYLINWKREFHRQILLLNSLFHEMVDCVQVYLCAVWWGVYLDRAGMSSFFYKIYSCVPWLNSQSRCRFLSVVSPWCHGVEPLTFHNYPENVYLCVAGVLIFQLSISLLTCNCIVFHPNSHGKVTASSFLFSVLFGIYCHVTLWDGFLVIPKQDLVGCELVFPWM